MVYGLLLIGAILAAEGGRHETYEMTLTATVVAALLAWLAHAYSTLFGRRIEESEHMTGACTAAAMRRDSVLLRGGGVPVVALVGLLGARRAAGNGRDDRRARR